MTIGEVISEVRGKLKLVGADYRVPNKLIWSVVQTHLRWLIKRESDKLNLLRYDNLFQTLKCVDVIEAPVIDDCCGVKSKCGVFRTENKIPSAYESGEGVILKSVFTIDGGKDFTQITIQDYLRKLEKPDSKYDKVSYFYYNNGYLYFPKSRVRRVMIKGYFEEDITAYNCCDGSEDLPCKSILEHEARIPDGLSGELMKFVMADLLPSRQINGDQQIDKNEINIR